MYTLFLASSSESTNDGFSIAEYYLQKLGAQQFTWIVFFEFCIPLILAFIIRFSIWLKDSKKQKAENKNKKNINGFIVQHSLIEFVLSIAITFLLIVCIGLNEYNVVLNCVIAPCISFILALFLDYKFLIPLSDPILENNKEESDENTGEKDETEKEESENINEEIKCIKNNICALQTEHKCYDQEISHIIKKVGIIEDTMNHIKDSHLIDKKIELKRLIYKCLNQGYATPEENDKITLLYYAYTGLGGNGEVKSLYEHHYLSIPIHVGIPDIKYAYGQFDEEK